MKLTELEQAYGRLQTAPPTTETLKGWAVLRCDLNNHLRASRAYRETNIELLSKNELDLARVDRHIDRLAALLESAHILHSFVEEHLCREEDVARAS